MASSSLSYLLLPLPPLNLPSVPIHFSSRNSLDFPSFLYRRPSSYLKRRSLAKVLFALTESDSPKSLEPEAQSLLQELADKFVLPADYFSQLPRDLRLDCGEELGEALLNISRAWELADSSTSSALMSELPALFCSLTDSNKLALGRRLISAGRRFQSMGQYGQGEPQMS